MGIVEGAKLYKELLRNLKIGMSETQVSLGLGRSPEYVIEEPAKRRRFDVGRLLRSSSGECVGCGLFLCRTSR